ncbi:unnamed protein product, partial [Prorocentrum cordatum]
MREGHGTRGPRGMDTMGEAGERGQKKAVRYPCSAIVGPVAAGGPPGETHRGRLRGPPGGEYLRDPRARRADARPPPLGGWVRRGAHGSWAESGSAGRDVRGKGRGRPPDAGCWQAPLGALADPRAMMVITATTTTITTIA